MMFRRIWRRLASGRVWTYASAVSLAARGLTRKLLSPVVWVLGVAMVVLALTLMGGDSDGPRPDPEVLSALSSPDEPQQSASGAGEGEEDASESAAEPPEDEASGEQQATEGMTGGAGSPPVADDTLLAQASDTESTPTINDALSPPPVESELASSPVSIAEDEDALDTTAPSQVVEAELVSTPVGRTEEDMAMVEEDTLDGSAPGAPSMGTQLVPANLLAGEETENAEEPELGVDPLVDGDSYDENTAVENAVMNHYLAIGAGDFELAYSYFGETFRNTKDQESWVVDKEAHQITSSTINWLRIEEVAGSEATVSVDVSFEDNTGNPRFVIVWKLVKAGGLWRLDHQRSAYQLN